MEIFCLKKENINEKVILFKKENIYIKINKIIK